MERVTRVDEVMAMSLRMARRLEELRQLQAPVIDRLESRLAGHAEYMRAAIEIARV